MNDQQINNAIAVHLGITRGVPDFTGDLNEMHEAEKTLTDANMFVMAHHIERLVSAHGQHYFHATARQRAEAFLMALSKWEPTTEESSAVQKEVQG